ncbi:MAG: hypothetical protein ACREUV_09320 [Burkholderiales bacterium]
MTKPVFLLLAFFPMPALAQVVSDGYFCHTDKYLAYEFSFSVPPYHHNLRIIEFDAKQLAPVELKLPEFQVRAMHCGEKTVVLSAADQRYSVDLTKPQQPRLVSIEPVASSRDGALKNLGMLSDIVYGDAPQRLNITLTQDSTVRNELRLTRGIIDSTCTEETRTRLVQTGADRKLKRDLTLYRVTATYCPGM